MTVRCLKHPQKLLVAHQYTFLKMPIKEIAIIHEVSTKTILRVLDELDVDRIRRAKTVKPITTVSVPAIEPELPSLNLFENITLAIKAFIIRPLFKSLNVNQTK